ncbi:MAG TPA: lipoprotein-releasing ABC transporter permease subunit [Deltaproteobacteria bacterium]|nr:lipoprotein-releasing ABC transporter permease subunit [Deltaproteobacteria bacterium]
MSYPLFIGLRYLKAKRKQTFISVITFISILGITVGVTALIVVLSVMTGFEEDLREKILGLNAHVTVMEFGSGMEEYKRVVEEVKGVEGVIGATPFIYSQAMLSSLSGVYGVVVRGVDIDTAGEVIVVPRRLKAGSMEGLRAGFAESPGRTPGILIGSELAANLGVGLGDEVSVISPAGTVTAVGTMPRMATFRVAGVFELGMYEYDTSVVFISLENAQTFFRLGRAATGVEVRVRDLYRAAEVAAAIEERLDGPYWTRTWMEMNKNLFSALKLEKVAMFIILALIILVAALNIISTLIMVVMEKTKDIAILKSMGATSAGIMRIFMIEGLVIGVTGTALGTALGLAAAFNLEEIVAFLERLFHFKLLPPSVYYIDRLPSKVEPLVVAAVAAMSVSISFLATLYPSWQASRLDPVEGLRYE